MAQEKVVEMRTKRIDLEKEIVKLEAEFLELRQSLANLDNQYNQQHGQLLTKAIEVQGALKHLKELDGRKANGG